MQKFCILLGEYIGPQIRPPLDEIVAMYVILLNRSIQKMGDFLILPSLKKVKLPSLILLSPGYLRSYAGCGGLHFSIQRCVT